MRVIITGRGVAAFFLIALYRRGNRITGQTGGAASCVPARCTFISAFVAGVEALLNRVLRGGVTLVARKARFCIRIVNRAGLRAGTFPASGTVGAFGTGVTVSFAQSFISEGIINRAAGYLIALNRACNRIAGFSCGAGSGTPARGAGIGTFVTGYVVNGFTVLIGNKSVSARPAGRCARIVDRANGVVSAVIVIKQKICPGGCSGTEQQNAGRRYFSFFAGDYSTNRIIVVMTGNFGAGAEFEEKGVSVTVFGLLSQT